MKTRNHFFLVLSLFVASIAFGQVKSEKFKVSGVCGMCKKKIETAAKEAGASYAAWNTTDKFITVKYNSSSTSKAKIEQAIAGAGYDTPGVKATEEAYNKLHECCKYEKEGVASTSQSCCDHEKCTLAACMKDGKCSPDMSCCKEAGCDTKDCCKKS